MFAPPDLLPEDISQHLKTKDIGRSLDVRMSSGSTNDEAHRAASQETTNGHTIVADQQSHGRGTRGRTWTSPAGTDLYFSIVYSKPLPADALPFLTLSVGLGIAKGLESLVERRVQIKWPNDIWLDGRKCAGVLVESRSAGQKLDYVVIGAGINVNREHLDPSLRDIATSMRLATGRRFERASVLGTVLNCIETELDALSLSQAQELTKQVQERLVGLGSIALIDGQQGEVRGVASNGALILQSDGRTQEFRNGTLTFTTPQR